MTIALDCFMWELRHSFKLTIDSDSESDASSESDCPKSIQMTLVDDNARAPTCPLKRPSPQCAEMKKHAKHMAKWADNSMGDMFVLNTSPQVPPVEIALPIPRRRSSESPSINERKTPQHHLNHVWEYSSDDSSDSKGLTPPQRKVSVSDETTNSYNDNIETSIIESPTGTTKADNIDNSPPQQPSRKLSETLALMENADSSRRQQLSMSLVDSPIRTSSRRLRLPHSTRMPTRRISKTLATSSIPQAPPTYPKRRPSRQLSNNSVDLPSNCKEVSSKDKGSNAPPLPPKRYISPPVFVTNNSLRNSSNAEIEICPQDLFQ